MSEQKKALIEDITRLIYKCNSLPTLDLIRTLLYKSIERRA